MILRRLTKHIKEQNWFAVELDFFIDNYIAAKSHIAVTQCRLNALRDLGKRLLHIDGVELQ